MSNQHQPTARRGMRASSNVEQPEVSLTAPAGPASSAETTLLNTVQTPVEGLAAELVATSFSEDSDAFDFTSDGLVIRDNERLACIREALASHRAMLHGLLSRKRNEASLNPASQAIEIGAISRGIARAETLLREIDPESIG